MGEEEYWDVQSHYFSFVLVNSDSFECLWEFLEHVICVSTRRPFELGSQFICWLFNKWGIWVGSMAEWKSEHLSGMHKALGLVPSTARKRMDIGVMCRLTSHFSFSTAKVLRINPLIASNMTSSINAIVVLGLQKERVYSYLVVTRSLLSWL